MNVTTAQPDTDLLACGEETLPTDAGRPGTAPQEPTTVLDIMARIFQSV
ncbi:hypothetical protein ACGF7W_25255 [Streptomyces sp. NPDC048219]